MKKEKEPFLVWASLVIFAIGIMGFLLYFEVDYLDIEDVCNRFMGIYWFMEY